MKKINLAIIGVTGLVGETLLKIIENDEIEIGKLHLFASNRSSGKIINFRGIEYEIKELNEKSFDENIDVAIFVASTDISKKYVPLAKEKGIIVVDNSSYFRMDNDVPLVVPEVNKEQIFKHKGIIANPNCSTIQAVVAISQLHKEYHIKRIVYSTYQAVSGAGSSALKELEDLDAPKTLPNQIRNNCFPHIDSFLENGYTKEEMKIINETKKILNDQNIKITATAVRVPITNGHSVSINLEFEKEFKLNEVFEILKNSQGVILYDDIAQNKYPMPVIANGKDEVYVGRIRRDESLDSGLNLWVVADNLRKGAATNAFQIVKLLIKENII